jgi:hypothetical protein
LVAFHCAASLDLTTPCETTNGHSKSAPAIVELSLGSGLEIIGVDSNNILKVAMTTNQTLNY